MDEMAKWTASDIPDQQGRTVVITGANSGLGLEATRALTASGARVIMACRNPVKAQAVSDAIDGETEFRRLDLADLSSVAQFTADFDEPIDVLINNAGVMAVPQGTTADGFERHIGANHLGPFALTGQLVDRVRDRVVTVYSGLHVLGRIRDDLNWEGRRYQRWRAYMQSKLANVLFAYELQRRLAISGRQTISVAAHPGLAATETQQSETSLQGKILAGGPAQSPAMGVLPILFAATAPGVDGGTCVGPDGFMQRNGYPTVVNSSRRSRNTELARWLWERSEDLTGIRYAIESVGPSA
jgi:NAD(P)-dependent dehydrogenase (short-subunit alcohol dehydrogenase family)